jgi:hypothetical protein
VSLGPFLELPVQGRWLLRADGVKIREIRKIIEAKDFGRYCGFGLFLFDAY